MTVIDIDEVKDFIGLGRAEEGTPLKVASRSCPLCGRQRVFTVPVEELKNYRFGHLAKESFKSLNDEDIEELLTGIHPETCQGEERIELYVKAIRKLQDRISEMMDKV